MAQISKPNPWFYASHPNPWVLAMGLANPWTVCGEQAKDALRWSTRKCQPSRWRTRFMARARNHSDEPISHRDAMEGAEREQWRKAIDEEYKALQRNSTWSLE